jgi:hypothetical protein
VTACEELIGKDEYSSQFTHLFSEVRSATELGGFKAQ